MSQLYTGRQRTKSGDAFTEFGLLTKVVALFTVIVVCWLVFCHVILSCVAVHRSTVVDA